MYTSLNAVQKMGNNIYLIIKIAVLCQRREKKKWMTYIIMIVA